MKLNRKLKSKRGESFVEILIAILIVAFGCMLIATMYVSSMNLNIAAAEKDEEFYQAVSQMEQLFDGSETSERKSAQITDEKSSKSVDIDVYGDKTNAAYKRK